MNLYLSRQIFFYRYEPEYYENWFYHSQWNIPGSIRGISDGELYKFVGFRIANGENPFNINYEVPPLAKHMYGVAEKYIGNPYWVSILLYLLSVIGLFFSSWFFVKDQKLRLASLLLFVVSPFVATQVRETMLDLPLMFFFLIHALFFFWFIKTGRIKALFVAGVFLGLASGVKFPIYTPAVLLLGIVISFVSSRKIIPPLVLLVSSALGYLTSYISYFMFHPNPIPWIRLHEKPIGFYLGSVSEVDRWNQWKGIFLNTFSSWWDADKLSGLGDWSPLLPVGVICALLVLFNGLHRKNWAYVYLSGLVFCFLAMNSFVPFWPRYLMPVIPLLILCAVIIFRRLPAAILLLALLSLPFYKSSLFSNIVIGDAGATARFISTRAYRELYRAISSGERTRMPEEKFIGDLENLFNTLGAKEISIKLGKDQINNTTALVDYELEYKTFYGDIVVPGQFRYNRVHNQWKLDWDWSYLLPDYSPESKFTYTPGQVVLSKIESSDTQITAVRGPGQAVYIVPRSMYDYTKFLNLLSAVTGMSSQEVEKQLKQAVPDGFPRFIGYLDPAQGSAAVDQAKSIPQFSLQELPYVVISKNNRTVPLASKMILDTYKSQPEFFSISSTLTYTTSLGTKSVNFLRPSDLNLVIHYGPPL